MKNNIEKRNIFVNSIEVREAEDGERTISGYAVKWEKKSEELGWFTKFREKFRKGAFEETLKDDDQRALWSHDTSQVLGRTKNQTLRLEEDDLGLRFELDLPDTTLGNDAYKTIKRGDVDGVSFGFSMKKEEWDESDPEDITRTILKARLFEISPVAFPAYPDSAVSARDNDPYKEYVDSKRNGEKPDFELKRKKLNLKMKESEM